MNKIGKSARATDRVKWQRNLSAYWQERGMPSYCEIRSVHCINIFLSPAHSKDRRDIYTEEDFFEIVWACEKCHFWADRNIAKDDRLTLFKAIIEARGN
jgi:hypothetical protein